MCTVSNTPSRKLHTAVRFKGHSRTVGSLYGTCFKCSFWRLQVEPKTPLHLLEVRCRLDRMEGAVPCNDGYNTCCKWSKWECHGAHVGHQKVFRVWDFPTSSTVQHPSCTNEMEILAQPVGSRSGS